MHPDRFAELARAGYNRIPVMREVLADLDTPLSAYLKLADEPYTYLLESVQGGEKWGRYSIIGLRARTVLRVNGHLVRIEHDGHMLETFTAPDPLVAVDEFQVRYKVPAVDGLPRFTGGLVGHFGYDCVRYVEKKLAHAPHPDPIGTPDILLMLSEDVVVFDNLRDSIFLITHADPNETDALSRAEARLTALTEKLRAPVPISATTAGEGHAPQEAEFVSGFGAERFKAGVDRIKDYELAGDIMQVVLAQRLSAPFTAAPLALYRALRHLNPSPYMYFLHCGDYHIVGSSPEILARVEDGMVTVRPIAGTRVRGATPEEDKALEQDLLADPKEVAEHLMLIDLGRNDVGRVSEIGGVHVTEQMVVERYSHVMHIVSNVDGRLKPGVSALDVLRATLPAGTLSGAPKVRAMEIIDELEPVKRGVYGGAVGYLAWNGAMDTAIAIRTAVIKNGQIHIQAGAGVVADSVPESEWQETLNKARAVVRACQLVAQGLSQR